MHNEDIISDGVWTQFWEKFQKEYGEIGGEAQWIPNCTSEAQIGMHGGPEHVQLLVLRRYDMEQPWFLYPSQIRSIMEQVHEGTSFADALEQAVKKTR